MITEDRLVVTPPWYTTVMDTNAENATGVPSDDVSLVRQMRRQTPAGQIIGGIAASIAFEAVRTILDVDDRYLRLGLLIGVAPVLMLMGEFLINWRLRRMLTRTLTVLLAVAGLVCWSPLILTVALLASHHVRNPAGTLWATFAFDAALGISIWAIALSLHRRRIRSAEDPRVEASRSTLRTFFGADEDEPPVWAAQLAQSVTILHERLDKFQPPKRSRRRWWSD